MAVAHSILVVIYHMLKTGAVFKEAGAAFFDCIKPERAVKNLLKRLESLGYDATLTPRAA
jgi:hypothetical protein